MERARVRRDEIRWLVAAQRADFWNAHRAEDAEPVTAAHFMPGAVVRTKEDEDREFIDRIQAGDKFETPPEQIAAFRQSLEENFEGIESTAGAVTSMGLSGKPEPFIKC